MAFDEITFDEAISRGSLGSRLRPIERIVSDSGFEDRVALWSNSKRVYDAKYGVRDLNVQIPQILKFWEARGGGLKGFRFKDPIDFTSLEDTSLTVTKDDQSIGIGDTINKIFRLTKLYSDAAGSYTRRIFKPRSGTVLVALNGSLQTETTHYTIDYTTGIITFVTAPGSSVAVTAGYEYDVPVVFQSDDFSYALNENLASDIPSIIMEELFIKDT